MKMTLRDRLARLPLAVSLAAILPFAGFAGSEGFPLVSDGKAAPIVIPAEAEASTELAAQELADYVEKVSGVRPEVRLRSEVEVDGGMPVPHVEIGTLNTMKGLPEALVRKFDASDSWESHVVTCDANVLRIVGRDEVAELYGVYQFLEEKLGVRWFKQWMAEDDGEYVPSQPEIVLAPHEKFRAPFFRFRMLTQTGSSVGYVPVNGIAWTVRNGLQTNPYRDKMALAKRHFSETAAGVQRQHWETMKPRVQLRNLSLGGGHMMFADAVKSNQYFATHPEYFALVNGKRQDKDSRRCMSNPDVQRIVADDILRRFDTFGGKGTYLFGLMDGREGICECDACHALDSEEERKLPLNTDISTRFHTCMKRIADLVYAQRPDATLINWAYSNYNMPPEGVRLDPRTGAELCIHGRCYGHPLNDPNCERNPKKLAWLGKWLDAASWVKLYEYAHCSDCYYGCYETIIGDDLRFYKQIGVKGWGEEMHYADSVHVPVVPQDEFDKRREYTLSKWQWIYLAGKLTWDPDQDDAAILADAEAKYYGAAYAAMQEYQAYRRRIWRDGPVCFGYGGYPMTDERTRTLMGIPGAKEKLLGLLDRAEGLVADDPKRLYRVRQDRTWLQRYWIDPNDALRTDEDPTFRAVETAEMPSADGEASEGCWASAKWMRRGLPADVTAAAVTDYRKLCFIFRVTGVSGVVAGDRLGVVLSAPGAANDGRSFRFDCDLSTSARAIEGGYTAELEVDTSSIRALRRGEVWRVRFFRNPDGNEPDIRYPLEIGEPKLANGSFEGLKEDGTPKSWDNLKKENVVTYDGNQHAIKVDDYFMQGLSGLRSFGTASVDRKVRVSFRAWGAGKLSVWFQRYLDTPLPGGGTRRTMPTPNPTVGAPTVTETPRTYSFVATIPAGEWVSLYIRRASGKGDLLVDDVSVTDETGPWVPAETPTAASARLGTVTAGAVTAGRTRTTSGGTLSGVDGQTALAVDSAEEATVLLMPSVASLSLGTGSLGFAPDAMVMLQGLALGPDAVLRLPAHGLMLTGPVTADVTARVCGSGVLMGDATTSPVPLADGAAYVSARGTWTGWPSSGTAYVPADTTVPITASDAADVARLERIVLLGETSKVTCALPEGLTLVTPVAGLGTFEFANAGKVVILSDNRDLRGAFFFTNTTCVVSNEFGLGSSESGTCHFWNGDGKTLNFGNGSAVFTNHVGIYLHPLAGKSPSFGSQSLAETLVQDAPLEMGRYNTNQDGLGTKFKNNLTVLGKVACHFPKGYQYLYPNGTAGGLVKFMGGFAPQNRIYASGGGARFYFGAPAVGSFDVMAYTAWTAVCGCEDVFAACSEYGCYQNGSTLDLNGFDQRIKKVTAASKPSVVNYNVTSESPAQLILTGNTTMLLGLKFSGAAGYTKRGTGTHTLSTTVCDTSGALAVEAGTLRLVDGFRWDGRAVVVRGGTLEISGTDGGTGAFGATPDLEICPREGGQLSIAAGRTETVRHLRIDGRHKQPGVYGGTASGLDGAHTLPALGASAGLLRVTEPGPGLMISLE